MLYHFSSIFTFQFSLWYFFCLFVRNGATVSPRLALELLRSSGSPTSVLAFHACLTHCGFSDLQIAFIHRWPNLPIFFFWIFALFAQQSLFLLKLSMANILKYSFQIYLELTLMYFMKWFFFFKRITRHLNILPFCMNVIKSFFHRDFLCKLCSLLLYQY
jgi:hypothetical protein